MDQDRLKVYIEELASDRQNYPHINSEDFWPTPIDEAVKAQQAAKFKDNYILGLILQKVQHSYSNNNLDETIAYLQYGVDCGAIQIPTNHAISSRISECSGNIAIVMGMNFYAAIAYIKANPKDQNSRNAAVNYVKHMARFALFERRYRPESEDPSSSKESKYVPIINWLSKQAIEKYSKVLSKETTILLGKLIYTKEMQNKSVED